MINTQEIDMGKCLRLQWPMVSNRMIPPLLRLFWISEQAAKRPNYKSLNTFEKRRWTSKSDASSPTPLSCSWAIFEVAVEYIKIKDVPQFRWIVGIQWAVNPDLWPTRRSWVLRRAMSPFLWILVVANEHKHPFLLEHRKSSFGGQTVGEKDTELVAYMCTW